MKKIKLVILITLMFCYLNGFEYLLSQHMQRNQIKDKQTLQKKDLVIVQESEKKDIKDEQMKNTMFLLGGGFGKPLGNEATMLDPSYSLKFMIKNDNIENTIFGVSFDISYFKFSDNTYKESFIAYITINPFVTMTWSVYRNILYVQGKAGPGVTILHSKINNKSESDLAMTLSGGGGIYGIIKQHYVVGMEVLYHYYFQIHASSAIDGYVYIGYML